MAVTAAVDKVRILVLGDSGVGKTSLVHLIAHNEVIKAPSWTVGCSVEVKLHEYREGTPLQKPYFIEFWDLGGSSSHRNTRSVFYNPTHGIILVHDLTNRKSEENLQKWLAEVLNPEISKICRSFNQQMDEIDSENFLGTTQVKGAYAESIFRFLQIPILVVGTKQDLLDEKGKNAERKRSSIADKCGSDELFIENLDQRSLAAGRSNAVILSRFFDKVIERKFYARDVTSSFEKRRNTPVAPNYIPSKLYHMD